MMRRNGLIIFDCDGVLVDSELLSCRCLAELLTELDVPASQEEVLDLFLGRSVTAVVAHYEARSFRLPADFEARLGQRVKDAFTAELQPIRDIAEVLRHLESPYCVASSSDAERVAHSLELTGLAGLFGKRVFTAGLVANGKPAPDLFLYAAAKMRAKPAETLVIEDSVSGVKAARAAGMTVWGFVGGSHHGSTGRRRSLRSAGAERVFDNMTDLLKLKAGRAHGGIGR
jgi:HAD superfamily hydrolase (TIGR01509 family)